MRASSMDDEAAAYRKATEEVFGEVVSPSDLIDRINLVLMELMDAEEAIEAIGKVLADHADS